jgi:lysine-N-methylase
LLARNWNKINSTNKPEGLIVRSGSGYRFAIDEDGKCKFLDNKNMCCIHKELGFDAKVDTCKLYPLYFTNSFDGIRVGAYFSCPAIVENKGPALKGQKKQLLKLYNETEHSQYHEHAIKFDYARSISPDVLSLLEDAIDSCLTNSKTKSCIHNLLHASMMLELFDENYSPEQDKGDINILIKHAFNSTKERAHNFGLKKAKMKFMEKIFFRMMVGLTSELEVKGLLAPSFTKRQKARIKRLTLALAFMREKGIFNLGSTVGEFKEINNCIAWPLHEDSQELLIRYIRTRLFSHSYFGREGMGMNVLQGARFMLSLAGICIYLARMVATAEKKTKTEFKDFKQAVTLCDHTYGHLANIRTGFVANLLNITNRKEWANKTILYSAF